MRFRFHLLAFLGAAAGFAASADGASAAGCRAPSDAGEFVVNVDVDIGEPSVANDRSKAQLGSSDFHGRSGQVLGTTSSGLELRWSYHYQVKKWRNVYCFWVTSTDVALSYRQLDVVIASEYAPGSCQYEAVLDHENEHVEVAQRVIQPYERHIRQALTSVEIPTSRVAALANTPELAREAAEKAFRRTLLPVRDQLIRVLNEQQAHVDTLDNYRRTWQRCSKW